MLTMYTVIVYFYRKTDHDMNEIQITRLTAIKLRKSVLCQCVHNLSNSNLIVNYITAMSSICIPQLHIYKS